MNVNGNTKRYNQLAATVLFVAVLIPAFAIGSSVDWSTLGPADGSTSSGGTSISVNVDTGQTSVFSSGAYTPTGGASTYTVVDSSGTNITYTSPQDGSSGGGSSTSSSGGGGCYETRQVSNGKGGTTSQQVPVSCPMSSTGGGSSSGSAPAPSCSMTTNRTAISLGQSATISWTTSNAHTVYFTDAGTVGQNSSRSVSPSRTTQYAITAVGPGGSRVCYQTISVGQTPPSSSGGSRIECRSGYVVLEGQCVAGGCPSGYQQQGNTCIYSGLCSAGQVFFDGRCISGSCPAGYQIDADRRCNFVGCPSGQILTGVYCVAPPPPELSISATPSLIRSGGSATVTWSARNVNNCTVTGPGVSATGRTGSRTIEDITAASTYTLSCTWPLGNQTDEATVNIIPEWQEI